MLVLSFYFLIIMLKWIVAVLCKFDFNSPIRLSVRPSVRVQRILKWLLNVISSCCYFLWSNLKEKFEWNLQKKVKESSKGHIRNFLNIKFCQKNLDSVFYHRIVDICACAHVTHVNCVIFFVDLVWKLTIILQSFFVVS